MKKALACLGLLTPAVALLISCGMGPGDKIQDRTQKNQPQGKVENWSYSSNPDKMGRGVVKGAETRSLNTVEFAFPYQGEQHATLILRSHPKLGKDVILTIEKGQFLTGIDGCEVSVRFDGNKPITFWAVGAEDYSTTHIFFQGYSKFVKNLKRSKKVLIEAPFYQEGSKVFEFNVEGLVWEDKK